MHLEQKVNNIPLNISDNKSRLNSPKWAGIEYRSVLITGLLCALLVAATLARAATETVLHDFTWVDGANTIAGLISDAAGNFYGTTSYGGSAGHGVVFKLSPNGSGGWTETVLYNFAGGQDGQLPVGPVTFDSIGNLYGTTQNGGTYGKGTVFELSPNETGWTESVLYSFAGNGDGKYPQTGVIIDHAGNLYGAGFFGVFEVSPSGNGWISKTIYSRPLRDIIVGGLTMDGAGNIFGVSSTSVFELSPNGRGGWRRHLLHIFAGGPQDGAYAQGAPFLDEAGNLYGTTSGGGLGTDTGYGTVYELSPGQNGEWTEKILYFFQGGRDGGSPFAGIILDAMGKAYGATRSSGLPNDYGTVFELAPLHNGNYRHKVLWHFNGTDGDSPYGGLILDRMGDLYGTTYRGGSSAGVCNGTKGCGVIFRITP